MGPQKIIDSFNQWFWNKTPAAVTGAAVLSLPQKAIAASFVGGGLINQSNNFGIVGEQPSSYWTNDLVPIATNYPDIALKIGFGATACYFAYRYFK